MQITEEETMKKTFTVKMGLDSKRDENMKASIFNIERFAIHDGPGIRTTVFFKGCPLRCPWCANPESQKMTKQLKYQHSKCTTCLTCVKGCPNNAISFEDGEIIIARDKCRQCGICVSNCLSSALSFVGEEKNIDEIYAEIMKDKDYYDASGGGVTLSGGEVMLQMKSAKELLKKLKASGIHTAIETCGDISTVAFKELAEYVDLFLFDIKHVDSEKVKDVTGGNLERLLHNLSYLAERKISEVIIRVPVIPQFNYEEEVITQIFRLAQTLGICEVHLLPYHTLGIHKYDQLGMSYQMQGKGIKKEELLPYVNIGKQMGLKVCIGG